MSEAESMSQMEKLAALLKGLTYDEMIEMARDLRTLIEASQETSGDAITIDELASVLSSWAEENLPDPEPDA